jgi:quercetin dioxygenase-like cupin family protein
MMLHSYTGSDGKSHAMVYDEIPNGVIKVDPSTPIIVRSIEPGRFADWHVSPRRLILVTLSGEGELGYEDGTKVRQRAGDMHLELDETGKGHTSRVIGDKPRVVMIIPLL